eukprot:scaffold20325_cov130-Isochrysis_galbana.AAC.5
MPRSARSGGRAEDLPCSRRRQHRRPTAPPHEARSESASSLAPPHQIARPSAQPRREATLVQPRTAL